MKYNTKRREEILSFLRENKDRAYSAEEIMEAVLTDGSGESTAYRMLKQLVEEGCVRKISDTATRRRAYQYIGESCHCHLHLKCKGCGRLVHLDEEISEKLCSIIRSAGGFDVDAGEMLFGRCDACGGGV